VRVEVVSRWAPPLAGVAAAALAVGARVAFWNAPLTADEGGYAEVARLWRSGAALYDDAWVDRPQGLLLVYRALLEVGGGSTESLRIAAAFAAMLVVGATIVLAARVCGRLEAIAAGLLLGTFAASPFIESFTLSGELLGSLPAVLSLLAFTGYLRSRRPVWLVAAGLLTGSAVLIKQSAFDGGLAAALFLLVTERRAGVGKAGVLVGAAALPVALAAWSAPSFHDWWGAVVAYRADGDSLFIGSGAHRGGLLVDSLPAAAKGLGLLAILAALGWRSSPLLVRLWLGAALVGFAGGGNFHPHYYIQLAVPLSILAAAGVRRLLEERRRVATALAGAAAVATVALTVPLWFAGGDEQARVVWPKDRHLMHSAAVASYVRAHTRPSERVWVVWAGAELYYLADRRPMLPYMWYRNVATIDGALARARRLLAERRPALVVVAQPPDALDESGQTSRILRERYRVTARVEGVTVLRPRRA
jgi:4-amino-4-deoxy-L-arabinose transferase-like glycosyltransferase